jgi:hypothetical protein
MEAVEKKWLTSEYLFIRILYGRHKLPFLITPHFSLYNFCYFSGTLSNIHIHQGKKLWNLKNVHILSI